MPHKFILRKLERFFVYRVLHVDDTPHRIALGLAVGIFITWTPTMGLQMVLTIALAALLRANKFVGVPFVWISNPVTAPALYGFNFLVGTWLLPGDYSLSSFITSVRQATQVAFTGAGWMDKIGAWWGATIDFFWPLWVGSLVVAFVLAVPTYIATRWAVVRYRKVWHMRHPAGPHEGDDDDPHADQGAEAGRRDADADAPDSPPTGDPDERPAAPVEQ